MTLSELLELGQQFDLEFVEGEGDELASGIHRAFASTIGDRVIQHALELSVVPAGVDEDQAKVLVCWFDGNRLVVQNRLDEATIVRRVVQMSSGDKLGILLVANHVCEQLECGLRVRLEEVKFAEAFRLELVLENLEEARAVGLGDGEFGQIGSVLLMLVEDLLLESSSEALPSSSVVFKELSDESSKLCFRWSTDEAEAIREKQ